jgi:hypothetical protein
MAPDSIRFQTEKIEEKMMHDSLLQMRFYIEDLHIDSSHTSSESLENKIRQNLLTNNITSEGSYRDYRDMISKMKAEYRSLNSENEMNQSWELSQSVEVVLNENGLFGLQSSHYSFTGGAHGNTYLSNQTYRLEDLSILALDSLILPAEKTRFIAFCESEFRRDREITADESLGSHGFWFKKDAFYLPNNFSYSSAGLRLYYNSYEVAPYAYGIIEITLSNTEITPFIKSEYQLQIQK